MQHSTPPELSASQLQRIDELCNSFEESFLAGRSPHAEDYLKDVDDSQRQVLLPELIQLEIHYRPESSAAELALRFPDVERSWLESLNRSTDDNEHPSIPGYFIIEELGRGGMGTVYLAADLNLHRRVALKMLHRTSHGSAEHRRRFLGEARAAARLHHPNLVQIFDAGETDGHPFLIFELVEGGTLSDRAKAEPLTCEDTAALMETLCFALQFAHDRHIIHRDLKPSNILLGNDGVARISDFGLAKIVDEDAQQSISGLVLGTPSYMAPEQAAGLPGAISPAVDIYSLGAILYELLTGRPPFKAASIAETLEQVRSSAPIAPGTLRKGLPRDLETICLKCLEKEPARRYISARLLGEEFARFRRGESIIARPVGALERAVRWCRRHPVPTSMTIALIVVVIAAFAAVSWQWKEAVAQKQLAELNATKFQVERDRAMTATIQAELSADEAEKQRQLAETHRVAADSRFDKAQAPIQELIRIGVELVRQPHMEARGRRALEKALQFRQAMLEEKTDDPEARYATASTLQTLAWTLLEHGELGEALLTYDESLKLLEDLHAEVPADLRFLRLLRHVCLERGATLQYLDQLDAAEQSSRDSVRYAEELIAAGVQDPGDQIGLGNALTNWAAKLVALGRPDEAATVSRRAIDIHRELISSHPGSNAHQKSLALALSSLASQIWTSDRAAAETIANEALEIRRRLVAGTDAPREEGMYLLFSLNQLISWYTSTGRVDEAERLLTEAMESARVSRMAFPEFFGTRYGYIATQVSGCKLARQLGNDDQTETLLNEMREELAAALADFPDRADLLTLDAWRRHQSGVLLAKRGETIAAMSLVVTAMRDLSRLQAQSPTPLRNRAEIISAARTAIGIGSAFEFEAEKLEASRELAAQMPGSADALNSLAWRQLCVRDESLRNPLQAEESVCRAIEMHADRPQYHNTLGTAYYYQNRLHEAELEFQRSLELKTPAPPYDWCFLAMIQHRRGNIEEAMELIEKAEEWERKHLPNDEELRFLLEQARSMPGMRPTAND